MSELGSHIRFPLYDKLASRLKPREQLVSNNLTMLCAKLAKDMSYRNAADTVNSFMHWTGDDAMSWTTQKDRLVVLGNSISKAQSEQARSILRELGVDPEPEAKVVIPEASNVPCCAVRPKLPENVSEEEAAKVVSDINKTREKDREKVTCMDKVRKTEASAEGCCIVSPDDVGVKQQKDSRAPGSGRDHKFVENTVIHVQFDGGQHVITAIGMEEAFKALLAFLLANGLLENKRLIFLTDGARNIRACIEKYFGFREYTVILDWLHLARKIRQHLSMGVKGLGKGREQKREDKNRIIRETLRILWAGNADEAMAYLKGLDPGNVNSTIWINETVNYLERKKDNIACYAFRHKMGLRISSNRVEKANDLLVAHRQKNDGMAWSKRGSGALAAITSLLRNEMMEKWLDGNRNLLKKAS